VPVPTIAVVIPTRDRTEYLDAALASLRAQEVNASYELVIVDDGSTDNSGAVAARWGATYVRHDHASGINAARNAGIRSTSAPVIAFVDDDVHVWPGWLAAVLAGTERYQEADAFGGPIVAVFEGRTASSCGREAPPITTLNLGRDDVDAEMVWGTNMAIRRRAFKRLGPFDESIQSHYGDEEDWLLGLCARGGRIMYLAAAGVDHLRVGRDARLPALVRAAYGRGHAARASDERRGKAPAALAELRTLAGCGWHGVHYRCGQGPIMAAHSAGRLAKALRASSGPAGPLAGS
jgi:GT2 family glycosyltransferase